MQMMVFDEDIIWWCWLYNILWWIVFCWVFACKSMYS